MAEPLPDFPYDTPVPDSFAKALASMRDAEFVKSQNWQMRQMQAVRVGAHPDLREFERVFIKRLVKLRLPFYAHNMVRTAREQEELFANGVTKSRGGRSPHNYGMAVDIVHAKRHWDLTKPEWALVGHIGKEVARAKGFKLVWGGEWSFYDPAHWELEGWRELAGRYPFPPA